MMPDVARLEDWYRAQGLGLNTSPLRVDLIVGGRSNLTFGVSDGHQELILRRPPLGHVQATAHDIQREYTVIEALAGTDVPVPRPVALCEDPRVIGAPFYLMQRVGGTAYRDAKELESLGAEATRRMCEAMVDTLVQLHAIDPIAVGLREFGRPSGFVVRQVNRWGRQMAGLKHRQLDGDEKLLDGLKEGAARIPDVSLEAGTASVVHGDYRLDNLLISDGQVRAVIDWEMATLGDPLTDLALLATYSAMTEIFDVPELGTASCAPGFLGPDETLNRYASQCDRSVDNLPFYMALAHYKLAVICEGIHRRYVDGKTPDGAFETVGDATQPLIDAGIELLGR